MTKVPVVIYLNLQRVPTHVNEVDQSGPAFRNNSNFINELKMYDLSLFITTHDIFNIAYPSTRQDTCQLNLVNGLPCHQSLVAQQLVLNGWHI